MEQSSQNWTGSEARHSCTKRRRRCPCRYPMEYSRSASLVTEREGQERSNSTNSTSVDSRCPPTTWESTQTLPVTRDPVASQGLNSVPPRKQACSAGGLLYFSWCSSKRTKYKVALGEAQESGLHTLHWWEDVCLDSEVLEPVLKNCCFWQGVGLLLGWKAKQFQDLGTCTRVKHEDCANCWRMNINKQKTA